MALAAAGAETWSLAQPNAGGTPNTFILGGAGVSGPAGTLPPPPPPPPPPPASTPPPPPSPATPPAPPLRQVQARARFAAAFQRPRPGAAPRVRIQELRVLRLPRGARVALGCAVGCRLGRTVVARTTAVSFTSPLRNRRLGRRVVLAIRITRRLHAPRMLRYTFANNRVTGVECSIVARTGKPGAARRRRGPRPRRRAVIRRAGRSYARCTPDPEHPMRTTLAALLAPLALLPASAVPAAAAIPPCAATVAAKVDFSRGFTPARTVVAPGRVVCFRNVDRLEHNSVSERTVRGRPVFRAGAPRTGRPTTRNWRLTAPTAPGAYPYLCEVHAFMTGTLVVRRPR